MTLSCKQPMPLANVLKEAGLVSSTSEGLRMIKQQAIRINNERIVENIMVHPDQGEQVFQVGKRRFSKITLSFSS